MIVRTKWPIIASVHFFVDTLQLHSGRIMEHKNLNCPAWAFTVADSGKF